ncbi:hypothetical protein C8R46DRAFT_1221677 [Mycena filopes]|nr:hypothetical protein C8R46DRAFT_1221677 [Mycena filopes]
MRPSLPADVCWEIATYSLTTECLSLLHLSKPINALLNPILYRHISVGPSAPELVRSLANNSRLPTHVQMLIFDESADTHNNPIDDRQWAAVLPALCNLYYLGIAQYTPLPRDVLPRLTFNLWGFGATCPVVGVWADFLATQPQPRLQELRLDSTFSGTLPSPAQLPNLRLVKGQPEDVARFAQQHDLFDVWFFCGPPFKRSTRRQITPETVALIALSPARIVHIRLDATQFMSLLHGVPQWLQMLEHIILDEEREWSDFTVIPYMPLRGSLAKFASALDHQRFPHLKSVLLCCDQDRPRVSVRRRLQRADGPYFLDAFCDLRPTPRFHSLRMYAFDGCVSYDNWGSATQQVTYLDPPDDGPELFERMYSLFFEYRQR